MFIYIYIRVKHSNLPKLLVRRRSPLGFPDSQAAKPQLQLRVWFESTTWFVSSEHPFFLQGFTLPETNIAPENDGFQ